MDQQPAGVTGEGLGRSRSRAPVRLDDVTVFSPCRTWRYTLDRGPFIGWPGSLALFVLLNPSTADEQQDDRTVGKCIRFAQDWGYTYMTVCNLFGLCSTDPKVLYGHPDPVGPGNDEWIRRRAEQAALIIAAWGNHGELCAPGSEVARGFEVAAMLREYGPLHVIAMNATGQPKHPLYMRGDSVPLPWPGDPA